MRRKLVWLALVSLAIAAPRALAGAQARLSADRTVTVAAPARFEPPADTLDQQSIAPSMNAARIQQEADAGRSVGSGDADVEGASDHGGVYASAAVHRHKLTAFLADLDHTVSEFQVQNGTSRDRGLDEALDAIRQMSDTEATALHNALLPLMLSWTAAEAPPLAPGTVLLLDAPMSASTASDLEDVRARILAYYDSFLPVADVGTSVDPNFTERLATLRGTVEDLTVEELEQMDAAMASVPTWETVLDVDPGTIIPPGGGQGRPLDSQSSGSPDRGGASILHHIHPGCRDSAFGPIVTAVLNYLSNTAEDLSDIWSNDFFVAAFVGTNAPNIPKIITMVIYYPLKIVAMAATVDQVLYMNCNEFLHQVLTEKHDGAMLELTDLISGTLTSIDVDQNSRFDRVDQFHARYRDNLIRLAIEEDLGRKGDKRISLFQLPESLCITAGEHEVCGMLETAHDIVETTIETARNLGLNTDNAEASFADGELQQAQGFYKEAYTRYREAYVLAVRAIP